VIDYGKSICKKNESDNKKKSKYNINKKETESKALSNLRQVYEIGVVA
jgi:hypothetical protein